MAVRKTCITKPSQRPKQGVERDPFTQITGIWIDYRRPWCRGDHQFGRVVKPYSGSRNHADPRRALAGLTEPWNVRGGRWRTARAPGPRSGRRCALCQSSTSRATRVCPSPRARERWTPRDSWWQVAQRDRGTIATGERPVVQHANTRLHQ